MRTGEAFGSHDSVLLLFADSWEIGFLFIDILLNAYQYLQALSRCSNE